MLKFVFGRNYAGKTGYVRQLVADRINGGEEGFIIIVPEQFSYATEKSMLEKVGTNGMLKLEVLSFSRLAELVFEAAGKKNNKPPVDDGVRILTMSLALESMSDKLNIFRKYVSRPQLTASLVSFATELKQCSVTPDMLSEYVSSSEPSSLTGKLEELSEIMRVYYEMLETSYFDTSDSLSILSEVLNDYKLFEGKTVIIDEFSHFTKQELLVIGKILEQSAETFIAFDADVNELDDEFSVYANVNEQINTLKRIAGERKVEISEPVLLKNNTDGISSSLAWLEENFYRAGKKATDTDVNGEITVCSAPNIVDECNFVALSIKKLMREQGVRCRDIAVYQRSKGVYDRELAAAFGRYGVPYFEDKRQPVLMQPLIVYIRSLLTLACQGVTTELLMRWLKTGLTALKEEEICELENYAFVWQIKTSQWKNDFSEHPDGFGKELDNFAKKRLGYLNELRKKAVLPILSFKKNFDEAQGHKKTAVLYDFIKENKVNLRLKELADNFSKEGRDYLYEEQNAVWELVMNMLDRLYRVTENRSISSKRYLELFELLLSVVSFGELPQGLDSVTVATADRSRIGLMDYVFVIGANEGLFPLRPSTQGLLNDKDRVTLHNAGIEIAQTAEYQSAEEEFVAYKTVCSARKKLYVSFCSSDLNGNNLSPSGIVSEITSVFSDFNIINYNDISPVDRIESDASAFEIMSGSITENPELFSTLEEYFKDDPSYGGRVETLKNAVDRTPKQIKDSKTAIELFGKNMYFSASKAETYHKCPFKFFCRYGIDAWARKTANVDSALSGTILHRIFEKMIFEYKNQLEDMTDEALKTEIDSILAEYLEEKMGGRQNKTQRFLKQYDAIGQRAFSILKRIIEEFKTCEFMPVDFELKIGSDGDIPAYELKLDDGGVISLSGVVDRVDVMEKDGKKYLRIIDYKSNGKTFDLSDVFCGLSMQMLIYLFAIYANGKDKYGDVIPSGIFYMSAKPQDPCLPRNATQEQIDKIRQKSSKNKLSGMLIDDITAAAGMEKDLEGLFIPAFLDKDGNLSGKVIPYEKLLKLNDKIDSILKETAMSLHSGKIEAKPDDKHTCENCEFRSICGFEENDPTLEKTDMDFDEAVEAIDAVTTQKSDTEGGELNG